MISSRVVRETIVKLLTGNKEKIAQDDFSTVGPLIKAVAFSRIDGDALADYRELGIFNDKSRVKDVSAEEAVSKLIASL